MQNAELVTHRNSTSQKKKKKTIYRFFYNNIQRPIKRLRGRGREVIGEFNLSAGEGENGRVGEAQRAGVKPARWRKN